MLEKIVLFSIRARGAMLAVLGVLLLAGGWALKTLPIDAMPDISTVQVTVITTAGGLSPEEMEQKVTVPLENALNGTPGSTKIRSTSRAGLSSVTLIFADGTNVWFARQLVLERMRGVTLPSAADTPELAPVSTGLGEIYQFVVRSKQHSPMQLRTLLDWEIVPKLRGVPGVVEVNTMGGQLKQYQIIVDGRKLVAQGLTLSAVIDRLRAANINAGGGYVDRKEESYTVRAEGQLKTKDDIENVVLRSNSESTPVLVKDVAEVKVGSALRYGVVTHKGQGEAVVGIVMMLLGSNSRDVIHGVHDRMDLVRKALPPGVEVEVVYDRKEFVERTIDTVFHNLIEGVAIVTVLLALFLGSIRGSLAVVLGIPASMSIALLGMRLFGVPGDLMSLGAIDFGFLVDGPIVILEAIIAATAGRELVNRARAYEYGEVARLVIRPVVFAVAIIMLVYLPLLSLEGAEGKMFRPMALTMACALFGSLVYAVLIFPAVLVVFVPPSKGHGPAWIEWVVHRYAESLPTLVRWRYGLVAASAVALIGTGWWFSGQGAEFVPRIFEGDAMVTIRRAPSISLDEARRLDIAAERVLQSMPEVENSLAMTGRAEVALDPIGNDKTYILTALKPQHEWQNAHSFEELSALIQRRVEAEVPGTFVSVSQPIEDATNSMLSGSRADLSIQLFGSDVNQLAKTADQLGKVVSRIRGAGSVAVERLLGQPVMTIQADRRRLAQYGVLVEDAFATVQAAREGIAIGALYEGERRFDLRVLKPARASTLEGMGGLFVETSGGDLIPLREVMKLSEADGPTAIRREDRQRSVRVDVNIRGRDLVSFVAEAQATVAKELKLPSGYELQWGGQFENFARAQARLAVVVPLVVAIIFGMLVAMFGNLRFAASVFGIVPFALTGGMLGLIARGMPFSLPAAVGFIALGGVAVLNGVVVAQEVRTRLDNGTPLDQAILDGTGHVARAVLTTAAVAALGFLPMALSHGAGSEVQRPLATAVVAGMLFAVPLTLGVLPGVLRIALSGYRVRRSLDETDDALSLIPRPPGLPYPAE